MKVLVVGGSGTIGRMVIPYLQGFGCEITLGTRDRANAGQKLGTDVEVVQLNESKLRWKAIFEKADGVINLAGSPLLPGRWNKKRKRDMLLSRVATTEWIVKNIRGCDQPPRVFLSASGVGFYGDRGNVPLTEEDGGGKGFLADLCAQWEKVARVAESPATRVCLLRFGVVLNREGGHLATVTRTPLSPFAIFPSDGRQSLSWVHIVDLLRIIVLCLFDPGLKGPVNCTAPFSESARDFAKQLRSASGCRFLLKVPSVVLTAMLGQGREIAIFSQNVLPKKLLDSGFVFGYENLASALEEEFNDHHVVIGKRSTQTTIESWDPNGWSCVTEGQYELRSSVALSAPPDTIFSFLSSPLNVGLLIPKWLRIDVLNMPAIGETGAESSWKLRLWLFKLRWRIRVIGDQAEGIIIYYKVQGPYTLWWHEQRVLANDGDTCFMEDKVIYRLPFGPAGRFLHRVFIRKALIRIFNHRRKVIQIRFPPTIQADEKWILPP